METVNELQVEIMKQLAEDGRKAGEAWALHVADASDLENLQDAFSSPDSWFVDDVYTSDSPAILLYYVIHPEWEGCRVEAEAFWALYGEGDPARVHCAAYANAFVEGALNVGGG